MPIGSRQAGLLRKEPARKPCVGELGDLENLNKELAEKGLPPHEYESKKNEKDEK